MDEDVGALSSEEGGERSWGDRLDIGLVKKRKRDQKSVDEMVNAGL